MARRSGTWRGWEQWTQLTRNWQRHEKGKSKPPKLPVLDGTFAVSTDGTVLANNTEEGPQAGASGSILNWTVNDRTENAPTAR